MKNTDKICYTLYVDESGDQDLDRFRTAERQYGSDPFLVFGAALIPNAYKEETRKTLEEICKTTGSKQLHCTDMTHLKVAYFARSVKQMRLQLFGVVSKKSTVGMYKNEIAGERQAQDYYNKCVHYLLERVGHFLSVNNIPSEQVSVVFEEKKA